MVNINIEIPNELHRKLKLASLLKEKTLKEYIIEALDQRLPPFSLPSQQKKRQSKKRPRHGQH